MNEILKFLNSVLPYLPGWGQPVEEHSRSFRVQGPAGLQLRVYFAPGENDRLTAAPIWPEFGGVAITPFDTGALDRTEKPIRASFSINKAPEVITRDIKRRVLEPYAQHFPRCLDQWEKRKVEADQLRQHGQHIAEILEADVVERPGEVSVRLHNGHYGTIKILSGTNLRCELNIRSLSVTKAIAITQILAS